MEDGRKIHSEFYFLWLLIKNIVLFPIRLILVLFKKDTFSSLAKPFKEIGDFFWEARLTATLILLNLLAFIFLLILPFFVNMQAGFAEKWLFDSPANLLNLNLIPFFTNWFVHLTWQHLSGNMLFLFIFGRIVEKNLGWKKTALIYFGAAIIGGLVDDLIHISVLSYYSYGASGAISGLVAAAMLFSPFKFSFAMIFPLPVMVIGWFFLYTNITGLFGPETAVGFWAHLGGFFSITILAFLLDREERNKLKIGLIINIITLSVLLAIYYFILKAI